MAPPPLLVEPLIELLVEPLIDPPPVDELDDPKRVSPPPHPFAATAKSTSPDARLPRHRWR